MSQETDPVITDPRRLRDPVYDDPILTTNNDPPREIVVEAAAGDGASISIRHVNPKGKDHLLGLTKYDALRLSARLLHMAIRLPEQAP